MVDDAWCAALPHDSSRRQAWWDYSEALTTRRRSSRTIDDFNYNLRYFQDWADMTLAEIGANRAMVRDRHKKITNESGRYSANHAMRALRSTYNLALKVGDCLPANPVTAVIFNKEQRRRQGISADGLTAWWAKVQALENPIRCDVHVDVLANPVTPFMWRSGGELTPTGVVGDVASHVFSYIQRLIGPVEELIADTVTTTKTRPHVDAYGPRPIATGWLDQNDGHNC